MEYRRWKRVYEQIGLEQQPLEQGRSRTRISQRRADRISPSTYFIPSFSRTVDILDGFWFGERKKVRPQADNFAIFLMDVEHRSSVTVRIHVKNSPQVGKRCKERAIIFRKPLLISKVEQSSNG